MDALGRADGRCVGAFDQTADVVGPHPGGVHHHRRGDVERIAFGGDDAGAGDGAGCARRLAGQGGDLGVVGHDRAIVERRGAQDLQGQSGIVGPGIPVEEPGYQPVGAQRGQVLEGLGARHPLMALPDADASGEVVEPQGGEVGGGHAAVDHPVLAEQGDEEGEGLHQVGGIVEQALALGQVLVHQPELTLLQVADPAVDQLGGLGRRARSEVVLLDQRGAQAAAGGVQGHPGAGDAAPDDQDVEMLAGQALQRGGAVQDRTT